MPKRKHDFKAASVHLLNWPVLRPITEADKQAQLLLEPVIALIPQAAKLLEQMRTAGNIGSSFDAQINILTKTKGCYTFLQSFKDELCEIFKVSHVEITFDEASSDEFSVGVEKAKGVKCQRCWNYSLETGNDKNHPLICGSCLEAVKGEIK